MRYVSSRINVKLDDDIYRLYVTDALKILTGNTVRFAGGSELTKTYREIIRRNEDAGNKEEQEREAKDVIDMMKSRIAKVRR